ncbi:MAG: hypothetical protein OXQ90_13195 [Gammaproteobacteria bacterium]|nr:hypothetical protein [Gammaproteobacteria bacterium]
MIDTLKFADRLKNAGFPPPQAEGLARVLGDELGERMVAKRDLDDAVQAINGALDDAVRSISATIETLDAKFESKFEAIDQKFEARFEAIDQKFEAIDQKFDSKFLALEPRFDAIDTKLESQHRESSTRFNVLFGTMALGFTLVIGLIGYSLFSPRPAESTSPAVEHGVAVATAWCSPGLRELS